MHMTERKHGGWFVHRDDDSIMGNLEPEGDAFRGYSVLGNEQRIDRGVFSSKDEAADAIADED